MDKNRRLKERISRLAMAAKESPPRVPSPQAPSPLSACGSLVAPLVVGTFVGVMLDKWLQTAPLMVICFFLLGAAAGVRGVFRLYK